MKKKADSSLCEVENAIQALEEDLDEGYFLEGRSSSLKVLFSQKQRLLSHKEETQAEKSSYLAEGWG